MANWISSKLKAAENILHQIDQQAADSLGKNNERLQLEEQSSIDSPPKPGSGVPLKDQFKNKNKKKKNNNNNDFNVKLRSDPLKTTTALSLPKSSNPPTISDGDWTQLLSSPSASNPVPAPRILRQNSNKLKTLSVSDIKRNHKTGNTSLQRLDSLKGSNFIGKSSDDGKSIVESETHSTSTIGQDSVRNNTSDKPPVVDTKEDHGHPLNITDFSSPPLLLQDDRNFVADAIPVRGVDKVREAKFPIDVGSQLKRRLELNSMSGNSTSNDLKTGSSMASDGSSDSDMESGSTSDSESEHEREERRKKRERILAERAAAKAINAIKEKENIVAKLEGEKESLEKILEERAKQQAQEASQLQSTMMETMEAVELEKQKHNNTRMEILTRLAKLEVY